MNSIAVIVTVYIKDSLNNVKCSLSSLYNQTIKNFDIFVQEDGVVSKEVDDYLNGELSDNRIKYLGKRDENMGFDFSLNELIQIVLKDGYKYIARMDADDLSINNRLERQVIFLDKFLNIDVCGTYIREFGDGIDYNKTVTYPLEHGDMFKFFKKRVPLAHVTALFRDSYFQKAGLYETSGHINNGDTIMWMKGFKNGCKFANIDFIGVKVRVTNDFFGRRSGYSKAISDLKNRFQVNKELKYGYVSYIYALAVLTINILPPSIKKLAYKYLRG